VGDLYQRITTKGKSKKLALRADSNFWFHFRFRSN